MMNARKSKSHNIVPFGHGHGVGETKFSKSGNALDQIHHDLVPTHGGGMKRHGDSMMDPNQKRRAAFGDITNALHENKSMQKKQGEMKKSKIPAAKMVLKPQDNNIRNKKAEKKKQVKQVRRDTMSEGEEAELSDEIKQLSQGSQMSSSQESCSSLSSTDSEKDITSSPGRDLDATFTISLDDGPPKDVDDVDKENLHDVAQAALYANDIFKYYKERELKFMVPMYMDKQRYLTSNMRAILVDWLVEVQENFELNHETLYLAVKLVDTYLSLKIVAKELLQLVGAASLFISCKFDERCPPLVEDFLYICDDAYKAKDFLEMERNILKTIGFDIGMPLSYRFLRRYSKCARASMETLTLARYILEMSLMEYEFIKYRESKMAASCLYLAMKMKKTGEWNKTMVYYTGYNQEDLESLAAELNSMIASPPKNLNTISSKYSHKVFYEVAKTKALSTEELQAR